MEGGFGDSRSILPKGTVFLKNLRNFRSIDSRRSFERRFRLAGDELIVSNSLRGAPLGGRLGENDRDFSRGFLIEEI